MRLDQTPGRPDQDYEQYGRIEAWRRVPGSGDRPSPTYGRAGVERHDILPQPWHQPRLYPSVERLGGHRRRRCRAAIGPHRTHQRQVVAPIHRTVRRIPALGRACDQPIAISRRPSTATGRRGSACWIAVEMSGAGAERQVGRVHLTPPFLTRILAPVLADTRGTGALGIHPPVTHGPFPRSWHRRSRTKAWAPRCQSAIATPPRGAAPQFRRPILRHPSLQRQCRANGARELVVSPSPALHSDGSSRNDVICSWHDASWVPRTSIQVAPGI